MTAATRIHRGPYRVLRRLARKLLKPLRLAVIRHQIALNAEHKRQVELMTRLRAVEGGFA
jgi:hypothetical protein